MPRKIVFQGAVHEFPDAATEDQVRTALMGMAKPAAAPKQEAAPRSWIDSVSDYAKGAWGNLAETGQGMVDLVTTRPDKTLKGIGEAQDEIRLKAEESFKKGDYATGIRHVLGYLAPMAGPGIDRAGDKAQEGKVAEALGEATSIGLQMAGPGALARGAPAMGAAVDAGKAAVRNTAVKVAELAKAPGAPQMISGAAEAAAGGAALLAGHPIVGGIEIARGVNRFAKGRQVSSIADRVKAAAEQAKAAIGDPSQFTGTAPLAPVTTAPPGPIPVGLGLPTEALPVAVAAAAEIAPKLLDDVAKGQLGKPFARLSLQEQAAIRSLAERIAVAERGAPTPPAAPPAPPPAVVPPGAEVIPIRSAEPVPAAAPAASIAEQLRDEMLPGSGAAPGKVATIPTLPEGPPATAAKLKPLMEQVPPAVRKTIGDANYREGARGKNVRAARAAYEAGARQNKIEKLANALHENGISYEDARTMELKHWRMLSQVTEQIPPSATSIKEALFYLNRLEKNAAKSAEVPKPKAKAVVALKP